MTAEIVLAVLAAALLAFAWWGAGIVFHPPKKSALAVWPESFGLRYERVSFRTGDGLMLRGWLIPAERPTDRTVLVCHGWGDNKGMVLERARALAPSFNLLFFDSRSHGESEGRLSTIGHLEARDFDAALGFLEKRDPAWARRLGVLGISMGAAMAVYGMARHPSLRCAVLESPFRSFETVVRQFAWNKFRLPRRPFVSLVLLMIRLRLGEDPEPASPARHIRAFGERPALFIAGEEDRLMPLPEVRALYDAAPGPKELWVVPGARHGQCLDAAPEEYRRRVREFFEKNL